MSEVTERSSELGVRAVRSGSWLFGARLVGRAFTLLQVVVLAWLLTPAQFGVIALAYIALEFLRTFTDAGFEQALIQRPTDITDHMNTAWSVTVLRGLVLAAVLVGFGPVYADFFDQSDATRFVQAFAVPVLAAGFVNIGLVQFKKQLEYDRLVVYEVAPAAIAVAVTLGIAVATRSVWALWWGFTARTVSGLAISYVIHPFRPRFSIVGAHVRDLFGFSKWIYLSSVLLFALNQGDDIAVGRVEGTIALGLYQMSFKIARLPVTEVNSTLSRVLFPAYAEIQDDIPRLRKAYLTSLSYVLLATAPFCFGIFVIAPYAVPGILGEKWLDAVDAVQVFALLGLLVSVGSTTTSVFHAVGTPQITTKAQFVRGIVMFSLLYPMMDRWGIVGAAWAVVVSELTIGTHLLVSASRVLGARLRELVSTGALQLVASTVMAVVVWALAKAPNDPTAVPVVLLLTGCGAATYLVAILGLDRVTGFGLTSGIRRRVMQATARQ